MYEELYVKFKDGSVDYFSPLDEMALCKTSDTITITWYGTVSIFNEMLKLENIDELAINKMVDENTIVESNVIFNNNIDCICEFDNLNNSTYAILK